VRGQRLYDMATQGSQCPGGYSVIEDQEECNAAATSLVLSDTVSYRLGGSTSYPHGCYWKISTLELYFNPAGNANSDDADRPVLCKKETCDWETSSCADIGTDCENAMLGGSCNDPVIRSMCSRTCGTCLFVDCIREEEVAGAVVGHFEPLTDCSSIPAGNSCTPAEAGKCPKNCDANSCACACDDGNCEQCSDNGDATCLTRAMAGGCGISIPANECKYSCGKCPGQNEMGNTACYNTVWDTSMNTRINNCMTWITTDVWRVSDACRHMCAWAIWYTGYQL